MLFFLEGLQDILTPEETVYISLLLSGKIDEGDFLNTDTYLKLFDHFASEIPYGVAKCRTGEPDLWIINNLKIIYSTGHIDFSICGVEDEYYEEVELYKTYGGS
tara:strand:+ start:9724 stop:10035 length:312 start_codon:yes stop_codon:yes gene_type:complete